MKIIETFKNFKPLRRNVMSRMMKKWLFSQILVSLLVH